MIGQVAKDLSGYQGILGICCRAWHKVAVAEGVPALARLAPLRSQGISFPIWKTSGWNWFVGVHLSGLSF